MAADDGTTVRTMGDLVCATGIEPVAFQPWEGSQPVDSVANAVSVPTIADSAAAIALSRSDTECW